jgi:hypothetical protein
MEPVPEGPSINIPMVGPLAAGSPINPVARLPRGTRAREDEHIVPGSHDLRRLGILIGRSGNDSRICEREGHGL